MAEGQTQPFHDQDDYGLQPKLARIAQRPGALPQATVRRGLRPKRKSFTSLPAEVALIEFVSWKHQFTESANSPKHCRRTIHFRWALFWNALGNPHFTWTLIIAFGAWPWIHKFSLGDLRRPDGWVTLRGTRGGNVCLSRFSFFWTDLKDQSCGE